MPTKWTYDLLEVTDNAFKDNLENLRAFYPDSSFEVVRHSFQNMKGVYAKNFPTHNYFSVEDNRVDLFTQTNSLKIPSDFPFKYGDERNFDSLYIYLDGGGPYMLSPRYQLLTAIKPEFKGSFDEEELDIFETMLFRFDNPEEGKVILEAFRLSEDYFRMRPGRIKLLGRVDENQLKIPFPDYS